VGRKYLGKKMNKIKRLWLCTWAVAPFVPQILAPDLNTAGCASIAEGKAKTSPSALGAGNLLKPAELELGLGRKLLYPFFYPRTGENSLFRQYFINGEWPPLPAHQDTEWC
jgi:hypothetical protein